MMGSSRCSQRPAWSCCMLFIHTQVTGGDASPREGRSGRSFPLCLTDVSQHRCTLLSYRKGAGEERQTESAREHDVNFKRQFWNKLLLKADLDPSLNIGPEGREAGRSRSSSAARLVLLAGVCSPCRCSLTRPRVPGLPGSPSGICSMMKGENGP